MALNDRGVMVMGKHVLCWQSEVDAAPTELPEEIRALGCEIVTNGAGLWASQNKYGQCPPDTWYPDPRIPIAILISLHASPIVCLGQVETEPPPERDWQKYIDKAELTHYYVPPPPPSEEAATQMGLFAQPG